MRRELRSLVVRGPALVGIFAGLAVCRFLFPLDVGARDALTMVAPVILLGYVLVVHARRALRGSVPADAREAAWARAREIDADDSLLGRMVAGWVPVGLFAALALLLWPHMTDANPALACAWVVIGLPPITFAWLLASSTWLDACRDDLARAEGRSDDLFRRYWSNVGR